MFSLIPWKKEPTRTMAAPPQNEHPLVRMRNQFDQMFDRLLGGWGGPGAWDRLLSPGLDVDETEKEYVVRAEAPGFEAENFDVQLCGNQLVIRAERKEEELNGNAQSFGQRQLYRSVTLPGVADLDQAQARYRSGILELHLPKRPEAQGKRIAVTVS
jgi:HSP20 family protein